MTCAKRAGRHGVLRGAGPSRRKPKMEKLYTFHQTANSNAFLYQSPNDDDWSNEQSVQNQGGRHPRRGRAERRALCSTGAAASSIHVSTDDGEHVRPARPRVPNTGGWRHGVAAVTYGNEDLPLPAPSPTTRRCGCKTFDGTTWGPDEADQVRGRRRLRHPGHAGGGGVRRLHPRPSARAARGAIPGSPDLAVVAARLRRRAAAYHPGRHHARRDRWRSARPPSTASCGWCSPSRAGSSPTDVRRTPGRTTA